MNMEGACQTGADCGPNGSCVTDIAFYCYCEYGCVSDADCGPTQVCAPKGVAGPSTVCIHGACKLDDECGDGLCGLSRYRHCCGDRYQTTCAQADEVEVFPAGIAGQVGGAVIHVELDVAHANLVCELDDLVGEAVGLADGDAHGQFCGIHTLSSRCVLRV